MKKIVTILFPAGGQNPIGGFKVAYEYANRLCVDGYIVNLIYPATLFFKEDTLSLKFRRLAAFIYRHIFRNYSGQAWFRFEAGINESWVFSLNQIFIPKSDIIIATAWETAEYLASYKNIDSVKKLYLIQHYEKWAKDENRLIKTWHAPLEKIVIAPWLQEISSKLNEKSTLIENGFDFSYFELTNSIEKRDPYSLCMLYHSTKWKGFDVGFEAVKIVKFKYPQIKLNLFGVEPRPKNLPSWVNYMQKPDKNMHNKLYNESAIFIGPSHMEGFCLTPPEAMQCGCAVVCTDIGGYTVVCHHNETALVSPVNNSETLARNIIKLIEDRDLRIKIAVSGNEYIKKFTWDNSFPKLKSLIETI